MRDVIGLAEALERDGLHQILLYLGAVGIPLALGVGVRQHKPRCDIVDRDVVRPELVAELARQVDLTGLGRGVCLDARQARSQSGAARDVDDATAAGLLHPRCSRLCKIKRRRHIDRDDCIPLLVGYLLERLAHLAQDPAGIVHQHINVAASGAGDCLTDERRNRCRLGHIDRAHGATPTGGTTQRLCFGELSRDQITRPHIGATRRKCLRYRPPEAVGCTCHNDRLIRKCYLHGASPRRTTRDAGRLVHVSLFCQKRITLAQIQICIEIVAQNKHSRKIHICGKCNRLHCGISCPSHR